jgi:uncharacterized protein YbaR (Trm112 family)
MAETKGHGNTQIAVIHLDEAVCPACWKRLCRVTANSAAHGIELWCKACRLPVMLEIS